VRHLNVVFFKYVGIYFLIISLIRNVNEIFLVHLWVSCSQIRCILVNMFTFQIT